jgi:YebC/PmpR family DNA-binding regulatory protein
MSGHSKWHNIRIRKGRQDAARGKIFTKLAREIIVAAKEGGGSPDANNRLRMAIQKAKENSMPNESIDRAIKKGTGELASEVFEEITYEGYGPGGVAVMVNCLTDNRNRTVAELRHAFTRCGGGLGESGCVAWIFDARGLLSIDKSEVGEEAVMEAALEADADDVREEDTTFDIITAPEDFGRVRDSIKRSSIPYLSAELTMIPKTTVKVEGKEAEQNLRLLEILEDMDDVQQVYVNFDIATEVMERATV